MITQEQQKEGAELLKTLAHKAWESSTFKEQLIKNPITTIESVTGQKVQSGVNIIVDDQTDTSKIYLNIPRRVEISELELSDEQLEMVAGGTDLIGGIIVGVVVVAGGYFLGKAL
ncbi:hypothetical protein GCM10023187_45020 [Nibrella viscosa]|uniref:NHLP leader peptide domain-containing protein n=1 Tax=Nibrella viscosa TaxID=1084524 RepID=A0ABP8KS37_9BACT